MTDPIPPAELARVAATADAMSPNEPQLASKKTLVLPRNAAIIGAVVAAALLASGGYLAGSISSGESGAAVVASSSAPTAPAAVPSSTPEPKPTVTPAPAPTSPGLGSPVTAGVVTFTVNSFESGLDSIPTISGDSLTAPTGGKLALFHTTYSNSLNQADLSCGGSDLFIQVFDQRGREMSQIFETYRIEGNPGCNDKILQDAPTGWNWAVQGVADAIPTKIVVTETINWSSPKSIDLTR